MNASQQNDPNNPARGAGGTNGGVGMFFLGFALAGIALYFFFDSVRVNTGQYGFLTGAMGGRGGGRSGGGGGGLHQTTSMGILFLPFLISTVALFVDSKMKWAWGLLWISIGILVIEILSRIRFEMMTKVSHLLLMFVVFAAGAGMMIRSYRDEREHLEKKYPETSGSPKEVPVEELNKETVSSKDG